MLFAKVRKSDGERVRRGLAESGALAAGFRVFSEGDFVFFPLSRSASGDFEIVEMEGEPLPRAYSGLGDALSEFLSPSEMESVIGSFDIIGDIAIIEIPDALESREAQIGGALLKVHKNLRTVLKKLSPMEGEFRVRKVKCIAGEDRTTTLYKESGVLMELDVAKVYFSVRLSHERKRIAEMVEPGERILALFAGVGPFPLIIAKKRPDAKIVAIELNPDAVIFMEKNIARNKAGRRVEAILGDARDVVMRDYRDFADRVLMPLPKGAQDFLDVAFAGAKDGATIHFYTFAGINDPFNEAVAKAESAAKSCGVRVEVAGKRIVRPYSPQTVQVVLDLIVRKNVT